MRSLGIAAFVVLIGSGVVGVASAAAEDYVVVVNAANPVTSLSRAEVSRLFLKRETRWTDGSDVVPFDLSAVNLTRSTFSRDVHGKPLSAVQAYWQQEVYSGRSKPPEVKPTESSVLDAVRADPGALAYVSGETELGFGIKVLEISR